ncbi:MAG: LysR family transcriptional regulator substrate-binding protein, partial [Bacilli bacterium]|nr:LysR family transcriptional regulator substrate-binding protein [Bacilli bacterium]
PKLKDFITKYPKIEVRIINKSAQETISLLAEGDIDIGIVSNIVSHENFNFKKLDTIQDIFIASPELPNYENIKTLDDLKKLPSRIFLEKMNISRIYLDGFFKDNNIDVEPTIETNNMDLLVELTKINLGVGATIKEFIKDELDKKTLVELPIEPKIPPRFMIMLSNSKFPLSIAAQSFWDYLK